jgi:hypothetical protein
MELSHFLRLAAATAGVLAGTPERRAGGGTPKAPRSRQEQKRRMAVAL